MLLDASPTEDWRWTAVLDRDTAAEGRFVYAVASTRIYCRPTCPSRRPQRRHVRFFATAAAAEAEGYRPCRRCRPAEGEPDAVLQVREARRYLMRPRRDRDAGPAGRAVGLSPWHLQRTFKRITGVTPRAYAGARRMERMKSRLKDGESVTRATYDAGYSSPSRVYDQSRARLGMTQAPISAAAAGERIRFTTLPTALGQVLVAASERGLCSVALGDNAGALEAGLRREYPAATVERNDDELHGWAGAVVARIAGHEAERIPLDVRGTTFQLRVWEALRRIPERGHPNVR